MISKEEFHLWRTTTITELVLDLLKVGEEQAISDVVAARGEVADLPRGAAIAYDEIAHIIRTGEGIIEE